MNYKRSAYYLCAAGVVVAWAMLLSSCSGTNLDAKAIEDKYGVSGATTENILTADGAINVRYYRACHAARRPQGRTGHSAKRRQSFGLSPGRGRHVSSPTPGPKCEPGPVHPV